MHQPVSKKRGKRAQACPRKSAHARERTCARENARERACVHKRESVTERETFRMSMLRDRKSVV